MVKLKGSLNDSTKTSELYKIQMKGHWANNKGEKINSVSWRSMVRFYFDEYWIYDARVKIYIQSFDCIAGCFKEEVVLYDDLISSKSPSYFSFGNRFIDVEIMPFKQYPKLSGKSNLRLSCIISNGQGWYYERSEISVNLEPPQKGTIIVVSGKGTKKMGEWVVYATTVYLNMSLDQYNKLRQDNSLPPPDHTLFLSRDAYGNKPKYGEHSNYRYGANNETPPGIYYLIPKSSGQKYLMYLSDDNRSPFIRDAQGNSRSGIAIHQYNPELAVGCFTTVTGENTEIIDDFFDILKKFEGIYIRPVRIIIEERAVKEDSFTDYAKRKKKRWTGILENNNINPTKNLKMRNKLTVK